MARRKRTIPSQQLPLPLTNFGLRPIHWRPWVADATKFRRGRRSPQEAWDKWPYVEAHPPHTYAGMFFDIDDPDIWDFDVDSPCPNWQVRKNGRRPTYHVAFTLAIPVARHDAAHPAPLAFYRQVHDGLAVKFGADLRYDGIMTKNLLRPPPGCSVQWLRKDPYCLDELREWLPEQLEKPLLSTGIGRNESLFRHCVSLAHQPKWARVIAAEGHAGQWLNHVRQLNLREFPEHPLPDSECRSIAKSCSKYCLRHFSEATFSKIQKHRSTRRWHPGQPSYNYADRAETVGLMVEQGYSQAQIAEKVEVTVRTVKRDLRVYRERIEN